MKEKKGKGVKGRDEMRGRNCEEKRDRRKERDLAKVAVLQIFNLEARTPEHLLLKPLN